MTFNIRQAVLADIPALETLIRASVRELQVHDYTPTQIESALETVYGVDTQLIADGTYFVAESQSDPTQIIGCGGWSKHRTLFGADHFTKRDDALLDPLHAAARIRAFFVHPAWARRGIGSAILEVCEAAATAAGFTRFEMGATLTGVPLYRARGYVPVEGIEIRLPNGTSFQIVHMEKPGVVHTESSGAPGSRS